MGKDASKYSITQLEKYGCFFIILAYVVLFLLTTGNIFATYYQIILSRGQDTLGSYWMSKIFDFKYEAGIHTFYNILEILFISSQAFVLFFIVCAPEIVINFFNKHFIQIEKLKWKDFFITLGFVCFVITFVVILAAWRGDISSEGKTSFWQNVRDYTYIMSFFIFALFINIGNYYKNTSTKRKLEGEIIKLKEEISTLSTNKKI